MAAQKAVVIKGPKHAEVVTDKPLPRLRDGHILVKTIAVALNPTDWKHIDFLSSPGVIVGCDYAGVVEAVGPNVKKPFQKGDRVCGFVHGSNAMEPEDGAFAEYIVAKGDIQMKIPDNLNFQDAATLGLGVITASQGLYQGLKLAMPTNPISQPEPVLIYGGSTATGTLAIQLAELSGYEVLTTSSAHNFELVKSRGANAIFDHNDEDSAASLRLLTKDRLNLVFDTVSTDSSAKFCQHAISTEGGNYSALLPLQIESTNIHSGHTMAYTALGEAFKFGDRPIPANPNDWAFAQEVYAMAENLVHEGKLKPHPAELCPGGLDGILDGLQLMRAGKVSGKKLVYTVSEAS